MDTQTKLYLIPKWIASRIEAAIKNLTDNNDAKFIRGNTTKYLMNESFEDWRKRQNMFKTVIKDMKNQFNSYSRSDERIGLQVRNKPFQVAAP